MLELIDISKQQRIALQAELDCQKTQPQTL